MRAGLKKLFLLAVIAGIAYGIYFYFFQREEIGYGLISSQVTRGDIISTITATGELNAVSVVDVGTQVSGIVKKIYVDFNSTVKAGDLIALIDPSVSQLNLNEAQAGLAVNEASVKSAQASLKDSERKYKRNKELFDRNLIARSEVDTSQTDLDLKRAALEEAKSRLIQSKTAVERARTNLGYTRITSPVNGVVINKQVEAGQTVASSFNTPTLFKIAEDLTRMQIEAKVDEADIGAVDEGQNVTFRVDAFPDEDFSGKVVQVRISPKTENNVVTYTVIIHVDNKDLKLKPGMTANVSIETAKAENVLRIPVAALRFTPPEDLLKTVSFDRSILDQKNTTHSATVWPAHGDDLMPPLRITTGVADSKWLEFVDEKNSRNSNRKFIHEGTELVINAQAGVKKTRSNARSFFRVPGVGRPGGRR